jgi:putative CocE/NonD family hydrolase
MLITGSRRNEVQKVSEKKDGMNILWNEEIRMDDGVVLRADIFKPEREGKYPVIISYGPYAKGLAFQEGYPESWKIMCEENPSVPSGSSNKYANWEVCDPEKWVKDGYVIIRVDSRGCGCSPGYVDCFSERETKDFYQCIEWAAVQPFSNGNVGLNGISYYGMNQWQVASMQPPHLKAMCIWEGASDWYRDCTRHGGIVTTFWANWYDKQVTGVQYGLGARGKKSKVTGENISGDEMFSDTELAANRCFFGDMILGHQLDDEYHRERSADFSKIKVPFLSAGNWGGQGLHLRGNVEGYLLSGSKEKFLELHGLAHWVHFYTDYGVGLQKKFFAHYLKGENNGFESRKPVQLQVRHLDHF